jgi:cytochrome c-type biogenesis protein
MGHLIAKIPVAFLAGLLSVVTPCVLPLVPGYLSAVSAVDPTRLGEPRAARRVVVASLPFILGFTVVFVLLGAAAAAIGSIVNPDRQLEIAGFVLVVLGLAFMGLLPWPERILAPSLLTGARRKGSSFLLGGAFAVCAAPCIGTVLAGILVLAADSRTVVRGSLLLVAYSAGLGFAFLLAGIAFTRAMTVFRWVRDHYVLIQRVSGALLVALGLLLFFHRDWWLRVALNRLLDLVGLGGL